MKLQDVNVTHEKGGMISVCFKVSRAALMRFLTLTDLKKAAKK